MRFSVALDSMNNAYLPGCAQFYDGMKPDPWQAANDELEAQLLKHGNLMDHPACAAWLERMLYLIDRFKEFGATPKQITMIDAFNMGSEERVKESHASQEHHCVECERRDVPLRLERLATGRVSIVCSECVPPKQKARL